MHLVIKIHYNVDGDKIIISIIIGQPGEIIGVNERDRTDYIFNHGDINVHTRKHIVQLKWRSY